MSEEIVCDPWLKAEGNNALSIPLNASFACAFETSIAIDEIEEAFFFRRHAGRDELWLAASSSGELQERRSSNPHCQRRAGDTFLWSGRACSSPEEGTEQAACLRLLRRLIRARAGFGWPRDFLSPGLVSQTEFNELMAGLAQDLAKNAQAAKAKESEIVRTARELNLHPRPSGTNPDLWLADCPGTHHTLGINAEANQFGCGWCRQKGGTEGLRQFVRERTMTNP